MARLRDIWTPVFNGQITPKTMSEKFLIVDIALIFYILLLPDKYLFALGVLTMTYFMTWVMYISSRDEIFLFVQGILYCILALPVFIFF